MAGVTDVVVFQPAVERLIESQAGPVGEYLTEKAQRIVSLAEQNASHSSATTLGIRSGALHSGIRYIVENGGDGSLVARIGTDAENDGFNYPAWHDQNGRPWLRDALRDGFAA